MTQQSIVRAMTKDDILSELVELAQRWIDFDSVDEDSRIAGRLRDLGMRPLYFITQFVYAVQSYDHHPYLARIV